MDEKLALFRRQKSRQLWKSKMKKGLVSAGLRIKNCFTLRPNVVKHEDEQCSSQENSFHHVDTLEMVNSKNILIFILWLLSYFYFIHLEFGAVFFCTSCLVFIYYNTRTGKKQKDEISAYSVFNRNCERIDGTFSAEQFEKQLRTGMY